MPARLAWEKPQLVELAAHDYEWFLDRVLDEVSRTSQHPMWRAAEDALHNVIGEGPVRSRLRYLYIVALTRSEAETLLSLLPTDKASLTELVRSEALHRRSIDQIRRALV